MNKKDIQEIIIGLIKEITGIRPHEYEMELRFHEIGMEQYHVNRLIDILQMELNFDFDDELSFNIDSTINQAIEITTSQYNFNYL